LARTKTTRAAPAPGAGVIFALRAIGLVLLARWLFSMSQMGYRASLSAMVSSPWAFIYLVLIFLLLALPGAVARAERLGVVATMIYLLFNEGYSASGGDCHIRQPLCEEAIRLARLLLKLFPAEPEIMGLLALLLLQHARAAARFDADGALVLLDDQDRSVWNQKMIAEGLALIDKAMRHRNSGPYQIQAAVAALHARAARPEDTDWTQIDLLYGALEIMQPSPVVTLNRAVAVSKVRGPQAALEIIEPLGERLSNYFHYFGVRGAFLMQLGRNDEARVAFDRAIALANSSAEAAHIRMHLDRLMRDAPRGTKVSKK